MGRIKISNQKGSMLAMALIFLTIFILMGYGLINLSAIDAIEVVKADKSTQAFWLAEAGLARTIYHLKMEYNKSMGGDLNWADGDINGINFPGTMGSYNNFLYPEASKALGKGKYEVWLRNVDDGAGSYRDDLILIKSEGIIDEGSSRETKRIILARVNMRDLSVWNYAIFANSGQGGKVINGNVDIRGSVLILGDSLPIGGLALDMGGGGHIGNNYEPTITGANKGLSDFALLVLKIPPLLLNEDGLESLDANLYIKRGRGLLSASNTVGTPDDVWPAKATMDGVYIPDEAGWVWEGNKGEDNVFSDNGANTHYNLSAEVRYPKLDDVGDWDENSGTPDSTYQEYLYNNALIIDATTPGGLLNKMAHIDPTTSFPVYSNSKGSISMQNGNLNINGIVYIKGNNVDRGDFGLYKAGEQKTITYTGSASIFATGDVIVKTNFVTQGNASFPGNIIGVMTPGNITVGEPPTLPQIEAMGLFYCEGTVAIKKSTGIAGSILGEYFDLAQVPSIFQVPSVVDNYPPGMIGTKPIWAMFVSDWQEVPETS